MSDFIYIEGLEVFAHHGVYKEETSLGQKFIVSAKLNLDVSKAAQEDNLELSVNYAEVCKYITEFTQKNSYKLIETVADNLARAILVRYSGISECEVTVKKPWAPIGLPLECVSVTVSRKWHTVYLSIGSNMGDKKAYLDEAVKSFEKSPLNKVIKVSSYIETKPYGGVEQDDFLNGAVMVRTLMNPCELLDFIHEIEKDNDRKRDIHWGPRTLDIDILLYDDLVMESDELIIPHSDMCNRDFVLKPLSEIAPRTIHPLYGVTVAELYARLRTM